ncbi:MAG: helix-turn-helix domain-containing protein [Actinomycetota bacterium]
MSERLRAPVTRNELPRDRLLSTDEVAHLLQVPVSTVYEWNRRRVGPQPMRIGRRLRYHPAELVRWMKEQRVV